MFVKRTNIIAVITAIMSVMRIILVLMKRMTKLIMTRRMNFRIMITTN